MKIADNHKLEFHEAARGLCIAIIAACIACVPQAEAITFDGNTSGSLLTRQGHRVWMRPGSAPITFKWGVGYYSPPSALTFTGTQLRRCCARPVFLTLATLYYFNGTAWGGTQAYFVDLRACSRVHVSIGTRPEFRLRLQVGQHAQLRHSEAERRHCISFKSLSDDHFYCRWRRLHAADGIWIDNGRSSPGSGFSEIDQFFVMRMRGPRHSSVGLIKRSTASVGVRIRAPPLH